MTVRQTAASCPGDSDERESSVGAQDRQLAVLYWRLQRQVHTNPAVRAYLRELTRVLRQRHIRPTALNQVGLELAIKGQL